jgi:hypothetical protein
MKIALSIWFALAAFVQAAGLEFAEPIKEVAAAADASTITVDFPFTNKSGSPVTITKADPNCPCLKVQISGGKLRYSPGESGIVRVTFEMGNFSGTVDKELPIFLAGDSADKPSVRLTLRVTIPVLIGIEPKTVVWDFGEKPEPRTIQIRMAEGQLIHIKSVQSSSSAFTSELKTLEDGKKYDLVITPGDTSVPMVGLIRIQTDCSVSKFRIQQCFATVSKPKPAATETAAKP